VSLTDPVGDLLTRIRNGQRAGKATITTPASGLRENLLRVLEREGYIRGFERVKVREGVEELHVDLKYNEGAPVINQIQRVSKPGRRVYAKIKDLQKVYNGLGISILSTPRGVMSDQEARQANVGGEVLCQVF
jgi:small subunit ribosomal protein S8